MPLLIGSAVEFLFDCLAAGRRATPWLGVLLLAAAGVAAAVVPILVGKILRPRSPSAAKSTPYECGLEPVGDARAPFPVRFYAVAMAFIILDVEAALLFPWAAAYGGGSPFLLASFLVFAGILAVGFVWAWRKGALDWA